MIPTRKRPPAIFEQATRAAAAAIAEVHISHAAAAKPAPPSPSPVLLLTGASLDRGFGNRLSQHERDHVSKLLDSCTTSRRDVRTCMEYVLDHADTTNAEELGSLLIDSYVNIEPTPT
jgi:hypothetical protein